MLCDCEYTISTVSFMSFISTRLKRGEDIKNLIASCFQFQQLEINAITSS